jgi:Histidine kinase-, DNA gyrase B-, and HSP90-like ATPase
MKVLDLIENIDTESTVKEEEITVASNANQFYFQIFVNNFYSNPIGSIVREIASNCFDSHTEAGIKAPIKIKLNNEKLTNTISISFIDYGVGMSPERIDKIFKKFFTSTKRADNKQIGGYGIGSKLPLAYKRYHNNDYVNFDNSYHVITIFDRIEYTYQLYTNSDCIPKISLVSQRKTTKHNGTEVKIPIRYKDIDSFINELIKQLYYFEDIVFEGFENYNAISNDYQIAKGKNFLYRGDDYSKYIHVCLGRVAYPINYDILNLDQSDYKLPIALNFEIGEIGVNASRENLDYNGNTINLIKQKLELAKNEIIEMLNKQYSDIKTLKQYFEYKTAFGELEFNGNILNTGKLIKPEDIDLSNFKYGFMKMPDSKELFKFFFEIKTFGKKPPKSRYSYKRNHDNYFYEGSYNTIQGRDDLIYCNDDFKYSRLKNAYLVSEHETFYVIKKRNLLDLENFNPIKYDISKLFNVHIDKPYDNNNVLSSYMQSLIDLRNEYFDIIKENATDYDSLIVPDEFIESRKQMRKNKLTEELKNTTIPVSFNSNSPYRIKLELLFNYRMPIFYGTKADAIKIQNAYNAFGTLFDHTLVVDGYDSYYKNFKYHYNRNSKTKGSIMFIQLAENNIKYMKFCKKAYHINKFFWRILYRKSDMVINYFTDNKIHERYDNLNSIYQSSGFSKINEYYGKLINKINNYVSKIKDVIVHNNHSLYNYRLLLRNYFDIDNLTLSKKQSDILEEIDKLFKLQENNKKILKWIEMPYGSKTMDNELIDILKKIMKFE